LTTALEGNEKPLETRLGFLEALKYPLWYYSYVEKVHQTSDGPMRTKEILARGY